METKVVNLYKETYDVYIGRKGKGQDGYFGNPFKKEKGDSPGVTLDQYERWFYHRLEVDPEFKTRIHSLRGKTLGCFCKPNRCHGDVIADYLNKLEDGI